MELPIFKNLIPALSAQDSQGQDYSPAAEKVAKARGFKNANEMMLYLKQREAPNEHKTTQGQPAKPAAAQSNGQGGGAPRNFVEALIQTFQKANRSQ